MSVAHEVVAALDLAAAESEGGVAGVSPPLPPRWISRPRLAQAIGRGIDDGFLLVTGGIGTGKTTAVAEWFQRRRSGPGAWLDLAGTTDLRAALVDALATLQPAGPFPGAGDDDLDAALQGLAGRGRDVVLVVDGLDDDASAQDTSELQRLVWRAPSCVHLVVVARGRAPLGLARPRDGGRPPRRLEAAELAFTAHETARLLSRCGVVLDHEPLATLQRRTGGWAAAVAAAAVAMAAEGSVGDLETADAVMRACAVRPALDALDARTRALLRRTGVVDQVCPALAEVLTGDHDAGARLEACARDGVLLEAVPSRPSWYRQRELTGDALRAELDAYDPHARVRVLATAADWFAERGMDDEADAHAERAGAWDLVAQLRCRRWLQDVVEGRPRPRTDLPAACLRAPEALAHVSVLLAAAAAAHGDAALAAEHRGRLDALADDGPVRQRPNAAVRAVLDAVVGRAFGADDRSRGALARLHDAHPELRGSRAFGLLLLAEQHLDRGALDRARNTLEEAARGEEAEGWVARESAALTALLDAIEGRPEATDAALVTVPAAPGERSAAVAAMAAALADALRGHRAAATARLAAVDTGLVAGSRPLRVLLEVLRRACGAAPHDVLSVGGDGLEHPICEPALVGLGYLEARGDGASTTTLGGHSGAALVQARRALGAQRWREASELGQAATRVERGAHPCTLVEASVVVAAALLHRGDDDGAARWIRTAMRAAEAGQLRGPLLRHHDALRELLALPAVDVVHLSSDALQLRDALAHVDGPAFVEPLTERERTVLRCLPLLMSNQEIAGELMVSVNTVKTHLKAVYRKLGVTRRRDALARARQLGLI